MRTREHSYLQCTLSKTEAVCRCATGFKSVGVADLGFQKKGVIRGIIILHVAKKSDNYKFNQLVQCAKQNSA